MEPIDTGALVGWKLDDLGKRMVLHMQTMHRTESEEKEVHERAVMLANYLFEMTGQSKPKRRSVLQALFGN